MSSLGRITFYSRPPYRIPSSLHRRKRCPTTSRWTRPSRQRIPRTMERKVKKPRPNPPFHHHLKSSESTIGKFTSRIRNYCRHGGRGNQGGNRSGEHSGEGGYLATGKGPKGPNRNIGNNGNRQGDRDDGHR
ncbi:hypothetical protein QVD17_30384 [Tagetes erecta]|uniref:Uncharacterized protein n=1 Tax=Tagetes erecta TaxID=13708 RepID=A0AAD8K1F5_TARER|nr:hypothetical protein QVD17_30384 [Tagetes erecta]